MGIIERIVDRCHVSLTFEEVLSKVINRLADGQATFDAMTPNQQKSFTKAVVVQHTVNRNLYFKVTEGRF